MMNRVSFLSLLAVSVAVLPLSSAWAKPVSVRSNVNDDYTRIVLDFSDAPSYLTDQTKNGITLKFQKDNDFSGAASIATAARVKNVTAVNSKTLKFDFTNAKEIRHFSVGNRVIVDVYGSAKPDEATKPKVDDKQKTEIKPTNIEAKTPEAEKTEPTKPEVAKIEAAKIDSVAEPIKTDIKKSEEPASPSPNSKDAVPAGSALLALNNIDPMKLAVYQSGDRLNIVVNIVDAAVMPSVSGDAAMIKLIGPVEPKKLEGSTLFSAKIPKGVSVRAEGGGTAWRIIVSAKPTLNETENPTALIPDQARLLWAVPQAGTVIDLTDPHTGNTLKIVPVETAKSFTGPAKNYVDMRLLPAAAGMVILPKSDGLAVTTTPKNVEISGKTVLNISASITPSLTPPADIKKEPVIDETKPDEIVMGPPSPNTSPVSDSVIKPTDTTRYFDFAKWQQGGLIKRDENAKHIMQAFSQKPLAEQADKLLSLAKMELSNGMAAEAKGYIDYAVALVPELADAPTVKALLGAAQSFLGHNDLAFQIFVDDKFKDNAEMAMWRAYALANVEDWAQAEKNLPEYPVMLETYPAPVQIPMALTLAEVRLRDGDVRNADKLLELAAKSDKKMNAADKAAMNYLRGESERQKGKLAEAMKFWEPLTTGTDDLYRVKAGLSLTNLQLEQKEIKPDVAIDRLEGFRYTWRGDELETSTLSRLGRLYVENNEPIKGLNVLRQAASLFPASEQSTAITDLMKNTYKDLFLSSKLDELNPVDALTVFEEFSELTPSDDDGDVIVKRLADRLVDVDLLPRAASLLQTQIDTRLTGKAGAETAVHLADIQLMDGKADKALESLDKARAFLKDVPLDQSVELKKQIALLSAEAFGQQKKPDEAYAALGLLPQDEAALRLRADIAWENGRFQDAADAMQDLAAVMDISPTRPVDDVQGELLLNWALALHKADNKFVLSDLRERYASAMAASPFNEKFDIITRPKQNSVLVDRASIDQMMAEVDLFKSADKEIPVKEPAPAIAPEPAKEPAKEPAPADVAAQAEPAVKPEDVKPAASTQGETDVAGADGAAGKDGASSATP